MSYGFIARNADNNVLVSDRSYNTVYAGKAAQQQVYPYFAGSNTSGPYGTTMLYMQIRRFRFDAGGKEVIPFLYNPSSGFASIAYSEKVGTAYDYYVVATLNVVCTVYCFIKSSSSGKTGWGMSLFDSAGNTTFTTSDNILNVKAVYNAVTANSSVAYNDRFEKDIYMPSTYATIQYNAPLNAAPAISKPAILYNSYGTANSRSPVSDRGYAWESVARFNYASRYLETHWAMVNESLAPTIQVPARTEMAVIIDGADYD